ncbi:MAG TPA: LacI family DNA-binding transcriptional regulator [Verrucomicrobiae bacterium]|jgi:DNA-binding LacI/PurR family transcriptional regulator|nr:LacI family DNA-binding transcriptional regulator [Verrucomicrobiae bacterium]
MPAARLKDIAAHAGVSVMTVSKALRGATDVAPQTKARIRALAQQMGYEPNSVAQGLRNRTTRLLGLILPTVANPIYSRTVAAIVECAHDLGYDLVISHSLGMVDREETCIRRFLSRRVDGMFIFPVYRMAPQAAIYQELLRRRTPTVILGHRAPFCAGFCNVESDDISGSLEVTRHLISLGHKRIAFLCGITPAPWAQERLEGYRRGLREAGLELDDGLIFNAGGMIEEGETAALQMLNESTKMTAIQAASDLVAIGAANVLLKQGLQIPGDVSIAGFGNVLTAEHYRVPLTTVRQPKWRLGVAAIEMMQKVIRGEQPESRRLPAELIVRSSAGPPRLEAVL